MEAEAGGQRDAAGGVARVAARAAALHAVGQVARGTVVTGREDAALAVDEHAADGTLHAVAAAGGEGREGHEVAVPAGAQAVAVGEVELAEGRVEVRQGVRGVEEPDGGARHQREDAGVGVVEVQVGRGDELLQAHADLRLLLLLQPGLVAPPAHGHGRVDADEDEEGAPAQGVEDGLAVDVCRYPARAPVLRYEVDQIPFACEGM